MPSSVTIPTIAKTFSGALAVAFCLALGACNEEPTEPAMRDAVAHLFGKIRLQQAAATAASTRPPTAR